jgi:hypothetical protein
MVFRQGGLNQIAPGNSFGGGWAMMVMMMASTLSLKASSQFFVIGVSGSSGTFYAPQKPCYRLVSILHRAVQGGVTVRIGQDFVGPMT